jgi:hypothetical protein
VSENLELLKLTLAQIDGVSNVKQIGDKVSLILEHGKDISYLNRTLFDKGIVVSEIGIQKPYLEANFLELIK